MFDHLVHISTLSKNCDPLRISHKIVEIAIFWPPFQEMTTYVSLSVIDKFNSMVILRQILIALVETRNGFKSCSVEIGFKLSQILTFDTKK